MNSIVFQYSSNTAMQLNNGILTIPRLRLKYVIHLWKFPLVLSFSAGVQEDGAVGDIQDSHSEFGTYTILSKDALQILPCFHFNVGISEVHDDI